jgi:hypothetical protein
MYKIYDREVELNRSGFDSVQQRAFMSSSSRRALSNTLQDLKPEIQSMFKYTPTSLRTCLCILLSG